MSKKPFTIHEITNQTVPALNRNFDKAYSEKLDSYRHLDLTASKIMDYPNQYMETGSFWVSSTGSPTITITKAFRVRFDGVTIAMADARHPDVLAKVTDVTQSGITLTVRLISSTSVNFQTQVTASLVVNYLALGFFA